MPDTEWGSAGGDERVEVVPAFKVHCHTMRVVECALTQCVRLTRVWRTAVLVQCLCHAKGLRGSYPQLAFVSMAPRQGKRVEEYLPDKLTGMPVDVHPSIRRTSNERRYKTAVGYFKEDGTFEVRSRCRLPMRDPCATPTR